MELSQKLQNRRKELKLTQEEVAEKIHVSRQTISNWETGRTLPDINSLVLISDIYDISLDSLIKEDKKMIKKLSIDTKEAENWFVFSSLFCNVFASFIANMGFKLPTKVTMFLLVVLTIFVGYIGIRGLPFLRKNQESYQKDKKYQKKGYVITLYDIVYGSVLILGAVTIIYTIIKMP